MSIVHCQLFIPLKADVMCGIFAIVNDKTHQAAQTTLEGLKRLEYRGYDSWGVAVVPDDNHAVAVEKHAGKIGEAVTQLPRGTIAIGHTRWATHGGVTDTNAHPHVDCTGRIVVIHNGIVENYQELKAILLKKHHIFTSETDTEVIAHLIEDKIRKEPIEKAVFSVFKELIGSNAIGVLDAQTKTIVACRNGSPLAAGVGNDQYFLASDVTPFLKYTRDVLFLSDGEGIVLTPKGVTLYDLASEKVKKAKPQRLDWKIQDAQKGGYPHFLLKEIMEQVTTIPKTAFINTQEIKKVARLVKEADRVVLTACGTASYCALATTHFLAEAGIESHVYGAYEFLPFSRFADKKTVVIAISQSGETADTLIAARAAKNNGAKLVAVVNARGSALERLADITLPVGAGPEIAVVSTKAFTAQLSTLYLVSRAASGHSTQGVAEIKELGITLKGWINQRLHGEVIHLAKTLMNNEHIYLIGKYLGYPTALEIALKIKETSYIHAEPFAAGELKHGVITLIQKGTPCIAIGDDQETKLELLSSAAELKARGGMIIGISPYESSEFDSLLKTPDVGALTIIPNVIVGQLLGYYLGIGRGADPDKPRNLAKSVTVK